MGIYLKRCAEYMDAFFLLMILILAFGGFVIMMIGLGIVGIIYGGILYLKEYHFPSTKLNK